MNRMTRLGFVLGAGVLAWLAMPPQAQAEVSFGISVSVGTPPPPLPVYAQPVIPGPGYIWTPGYWAWGPYGYYWVPGTWVLPPAAGLLWTPGWWGWSDDGFYRWHPGYWGERVGFYGGIDYGFGYYGTGFVGGYWRRNVFYYNRVVNNVNVTIVRNVYVDRTVITRVRVVHTSYNGGRDGIRVQPTPEQRAWRSERRYQPTAMQARQYRMALNDPAQRYRLNRGHPAVFATRHAGRFEGAHVVRAAWPENRPMEAGPERARMHERRLDRRQEIRPENRRAAHPERFEERRYQDRPPREHQPWREPREMRGAAERAHPQHRPPPRHEARRRDEGRRGDRGG